MTELLHAEWLDPIISKTYNLAFAHPGELLRSDDEEVALLRLSTRGGDLAGVVSLPCDPALIRERHARILLQSSDEIRLVDLSPDGVHVQRTLKLRSSADDFRALMEQPPCICDDREIEELCHAIDYLGAAGEAD